MGVDSQLLDKEVHGSAMENMVADELLKKKQQIEERDDLWGQTFRSASAIYEKQTKLEALKQALILGLQIRQEIKRVGFSGAQFWIVLILSIIKDLFIDIPTLGVASPIINFAVTGVLAIVFFMRKSGMKKQLIKWFVVPCLVEFVPGLSGFFPSYLLSTFLLKLKTEKRKKKLKNQLKDVEQGTQKLLRQVMYET